MRVVNQSAGRLIHAEGVTFVLREGDQVYYADEEAISPLWKGRRFPANSCISGWSILHRQTVAIPDVYRDERVPVEAYRPTFVKSLLIVPIRRSDPIGAIGAYWATGHQATPEEVELLQALADSASVAIANIELYEELKRAKEAAECRAAEKAQELEERLKVESALRESEERFRAMAEVRPVAVIISRRADGQILYANEQCCHMFHTDMNTLLGYATRELYKDINDRTKLLDLLSKHQHIENYELELKKADGAPLWVSASIQTVTFQHAPSLLCTLLDITDRKRAQATVEHLSQTFEMDVKARSEAFDTANKTLQALNELKSLEIIERTQAEQALMELNATLQTQVAEQTKALVMKQQELRALTLELSRTEERLRQELATQLHDDLAQLLVLSKMKLEKAQRVTRREEAGRVLCEAKAYVEDALTYTRTLMSDLHPALLGDATDLSMAVSWVAEKMERHGLSVTIHDDGPHEMLTHEIVILIYQSIQELLYNVLKHARSKEALVSLQRTEDHIEATVRDWGIGFDPSSIRRPSQDGGFGLFSLRERLELLGGRLEVTSATHKGTSIKVVIPLHPDALGSGRSGLHAVKPFTKGLTIGEGVSDRVELQIRVLLADDHRMMREGLSSVINAQPDMMVVGEASDGMAAIELAKTLRPSVILMDINMPQLNGIEATKKIKTEWPEIQVVGLTFLKEDKMRKLMNEAGACAFLSKGESFDTLSSTIRQAAKRA
jgi:PAS domain S-box-containing protein